MAYIDLYASKFFCFDFDDLIVKLFLYDFKRKRFVYQKLGLFEGAPTELNLLFFSEIWST